MNDPIVKYSRHYSSDNFWKKLQRLVGQGARGVLEKGLWLYYASERPETPSWAKAVVYGALGYMIFPADMVPDMLPGVGLSDDTAVLASAFFVISRYIDADVKQRTSDKLAQWFPTGRRQEGGE